MSQDIMAKIRLLDYAVLNFAFEYEGTEEEDLSSIQFGMDFNVSINKENELLKKLDLLIRINEDESAFRKAGFRLSIDISGLYEFDEVLDAEQRDKMLGFNGIPMLFSTARGVVAQLTAQTPVGKFILPSINIAEFLRIYAEEEKKKEKRGKKRAKINK